MEGFPVRVIEPPPAVAKQDLVVSLLQQFWLRPPLESMQMGFPDDGSVPMVAQAVPVQLLLPQPPEPQLSSCTGTPVGWPGCAVHGFGPVFVAVPVVFASPMSSGAASAPGAGGQSRERLYDLLVPSDWATTRTSSTVHAWPCCGPLSHLRLLQRGQTCVAVVRWTLEVRLSWKFASPVSGLMVPRPLGEPLNS